MARKERGEGPPAQLTGKMNAHILHYREGLTEMERVHAIRITDPLYNLLIMDDYAPVIGMVRGSVGILSDSGELTMENVTGFYRLLKNDFIIPIQPGSSEERMAVGAAVLLDNGEIIHGSNQENAAYPSGLCAERVALFYASSRYPNVAIKAIAINSTVNGKENHDPVYPCGDCRQVLLEWENRFGKPIKVIMGSASKTHVVHSIKDLLPLCFVLKRE